MGGRIARDGQRRSKCVTAGWSAAAAAKTPSAKASCRLAGASAVHGSPVAFVALQNGSGLQNGRRYNLRLQADRYELAALGWAYEWPLNQQWQLTPKLELLDGRLLTDGRIVGQATASSNTEYDFSADIAYRYTEDQLFDRRAPRPSGIGAALSLDLEWQRDNWNARLALNNALAWIRWKRAPFTLGTAQSQNRRVDEDGATEFAPTLSGFEGFVSYSQRLPAQLDAQLGWRRNQWQLQLGAWASSVALLPWLQTTRHWRDWAFGLRAYPLQAAVGLDISGKYLRLRYVSDHFRFDDASLVDARLSLAWSF